MALVSCVGLRRADQRRLTELRGLGIHATEQGQSSPLAAGALNLLPGFGNFYLGATTEHGPQFAFGFINLVTWPLSVVWGIPQAAIDSNTLNKLATIDYYYHSPMGQAELAERRKKLEALRK